MEELIKQEILIPQARIDTLNSYHPRSCEDTYKWDKEKSLLQSHIDSLNKILHHLKH